MNVLIVGLGSIARKHIAALEFLEIDVKVFALRSDLNANLEKGVTNIFDLNKNSIKFDFVIISNPTHLHYKFIEIFVLQGVPMFIEKPAIHSLTNASKLLQLIDCTKAVTYVACNLRFHPCILFLKDKLKNNDFRINELNVYCGSYLPEWRPNQNFKTIYSANQEMGGGVHLDLFHELDYVTWLFGLSNKTSAVLRNVSTLNIDAVDYANYSLQYPTFTANIVLNYYRRKPKRQLEIIFENETWTIDLIKNTIINDQQEYLLQATDFQIKDTYAAQLDYFINCLKNNKEPMNGIQESLEILKICLQDGN